MDEVMRLAENTTVAEMKSLQQQEAEAKPRPLPLCAGKTRPCKAELTKQFATRYAKQTQK
jgi:hypothetical protein